MRFSTRVHTNHSTSAHTFFVLLFYLFLSVYPTYLGTYLTCNQCSQPMSNVEKEEQEDSFEMKIWTLE